MSVAFWCSTCFYVVLYVGFLYRPFCHGALKLDIYTLLTTFLSLNITSIYISLYFETETDKHKGRRPANRVNIKCLVK